MQPTLADIVRRLEAKEFVNEQAIKQGVVLRLLSALGWDTFDPTVVYPEFSVNGGFVDYALCQPLARPQIFIEVKQSSTFNIGEDQLMMKYAFQHGVPIAILTDGQRWSFYLPSGNGSFEERRFYHLDLLERDSDEVELRLNRYLSFNGVRTNKAIEAAKTDHDNASRRRAIELALPSAWREMVQEADERLVKALLSKVESSTGYRADEADVAQFIQSQIPARDSTHSTKKITKSKPAPQSELPKPQINTAPSTEIGEGDNWYCINEGSKVRSQKAIDTTIGALRELATISGILEEIESQILSSQQRASRKVHKRRWLARSREELYANPKMYSSSVEIIPGWWLGTNYSNADKNAMLSTTARVAAKHGVKLEFSLSSPTFA
jgi:predicted type IV restriction endonuclease